MQSTPRRELVDDQKTGTFRHLRWYICGLLFFATTVNYVDRQVLGMLKPILEGQLGWSEKDFGWVVAAFVTAYAIMMPIAGRIMDWLGTRLGYTLAVLVWSMASMAHSLARGPLQFAIARFALGIGEAANFPAAIKTVAEWFPKRERALATGIFNSGSNLGAVVAPMLVPFVAALLGWRAVFLVTGGLDLIWIALWLSFYQPPRLHPRLSSSELALIESDSGPEPGHKIPYTRLLTKRAAWAIVIAKLMTDPVWWFYLYWLPGFLNQTYRLDLTHLGPPLVIIYIAADIGSIGGGWLSSRMLSLGWTTNAARKTAMLICALAVAPVAFVMFAGGNLWVVVALIGGASAAHQGWSANLMTLVSDVFPKSAVGSVFGLAGLGGAIGGMLAAPAIGYWLDLSHRSYGPIFFVASTLYLAALGVIQVLVPNLQPTEL